MVELRKRIVKAVLTARDLQVATTQRDRLRVPLGPLRVDEQAGSRLFAFGLPAYDAA
jgi:hypothetical protein